MALDLFKKKKEDAKVGAKIADNERKNARKIEKSADVKAERRLVSKNIAAGGAVDAYRILKSPHISERATDLQEMGQYIFKVWPRANKVQIRRAIESVYGVHVTRVNIINIPRKRKVTRRQTGWKSGYKKAVIKIKEGEKIEVLPH